MMGKFLEVLEGIIGKILSILGLAAKSTKAAKFIVLEKFSLYGTTDVVLV